MTDSLHAGLAGLSLDDAPRIDRVCDAFEAAWRDGRKPLIEDFADDRTDTLLQELLCVDAEYRRAFGDEPSCDEYLERFPDLDPVWLKELLLAPVGPPPAGSSGGTNRLGRFELLAKVGQGACGTVWRAMDPRLGRIIALKIPHPGLIGSPEAVERFHREARMAANLRHPGIVSIHDVANIDGSPVLVQDYIDGASLRERLADGRLSSRFATEIAAEVAEALEYAHARGAIHRDIKPANIVVTRDGRAVVVDFGLALQDGGTLSLTADGQVLGTPAYMSPEQASGRAHSVDARTDVYSLGVVLYEMLTGRPPFQESHAAPLLRRVIEDEPPPPQYWDGSIPRDIETVCLRAMAKEPRRRYPTAAAFASDLRLFLAGEPVLARPAGRTERVLRWVRRHPARAALAAVSAVAAIAIVGVVVGWIYNSRLDGAYRALDQARKDEGAQHRETESAYYFQRLALASREWSMGNTGRVRQLLAECPPPLRGWEWNYLDGLTRRDLLTINHVTSTDLSRQLSDLAYSPDGKRLATASQDGKARIWDDAGHLLGEFAVRDWGLLSIAWHPDGQRIATGDVFGRVSVLDASTGRSERDLPFPGGAAYRLAFSPDGRNLAVGGGNGTWEISDRTRRSGAVRVYNTETGGIVLALDRFEQAVTGLAYHPSGDRLATAEGAITTLGALGRPGAMQIWNASTGERLLECRGHDGPLICVAYNHDGTKLATAGWDRSVVVWDADSGKRVNTLTGHRDWVRGVAFSPDGRQLASGGADATLFVWNAETGRPLRRYRGHSQAVTNVAYHPSGNFLASCSADKTVKIWDPNVDPEARVLEGAGPTSALAFTGDGYSLVSAGYVAEEGGEPVPALTLWNLRDGSLRAEAKGHSDRILCLALTPDGRRFASSGRDRTVRIWDLPGEGAPFKASTVISGFPSLVKGIALRADGAVVLGATMRSVDATTNFDQLRWWNVEDGRERGQVSSGLAGSLNAVAYSPDCSMSAAATNAGMVVLRDEETGREIARFGGHTRMVACVAFSSNGRFVASSSQDNSARVWDLAPLKRGEPAKLVSTLRGHTRGVVAVAFSPDGSRLATGSDDATIKLWDVLSGQEAITLTGHTESVTGVAFSPDGRVLASSGNDATIRLWETAP